MLDATRKLSDAEVGRLFRGLLRYSMTKEQPQGLQGREEVVFDIYSQQIDRDIEAYDRQVEAGRTNGQRGGRPKKNPPGFSETPRVFEKTQKTQDKGKDKGKEKDKDKWDHHDDDARADADPLVMYAVNNLQHMSPGNLEELADFIERFDDDVIRFAIDEASANGAPRWAYVSAILRGYLRDGIKTVGDAKAAKAKREAAKGGRTANAQVNPALNYQQRDHSGKPAAREVIDLDKWE